MFNTKAGFSLMDRIDVRELMGKWGGWLFCQRSFIPVPFFFALIVLNFEYENDLVVWTTGPFFLILGEAMRCWGIQHIGKHYRTFKRQCKGIVKSGPYALSRNPLYIGNLFIMIGFTIMSELLWVLPLIVPFFFFYYTCIIIWEEDILRETFPDEALEYFEKVPRWWSMNGIKGRLQQAFSNEGNTPFTEVIRREQRTLQFLIVMAIVLFLKELFCTHRYFLWIPFLLD